LKLGTEGYSPRLLAKIEYAGANERSFAQAHRSLEVLAELSISMKHVWRITKRLGQERGGQRDAAVAAMESAEPFGWMVAAEAKARGFYEAAAKAVVGDGGNWIGPLADLHFPGFTQILDFLHLLVHLYAAATAAHRGRAKPAWSLYEQWLRWAWSGQIQSLIAGLQAACERLGQPRPKRRMMIRDASCRWPWGM